MKETFNDRLERLLLDHNMQKKELAKIIGLSNNSLSTWKALGTIPRADVAIKIARAFNVSTEYLITGKMPDVDVTSELAYRVARLPRDKQRVVQALVEALEAL